MRRKIITFAMAAMISSCLMGNHLLIYASETMKEGKSNIEYSTTVSESTTQETSSEKTTASEPSAQEIVAEQATTSESKKDNSKHKEKKKEIKKGTKKKRTHSDSQIQRKPKVNIAPGSIQGVNILSKKNKEYLGKYSYFNQGDSIWNHNGLWIRSSGCGPSAVAVCIANLTGKWVTPVDVAAWAYQNGYYSSAGSVHGGIPAMARHWGLQCKGLGTDGTAIKRSLKEGKPVVGLMGPGYFTGGGHFITLLEIDKNDKVLVADVGSRKRSERKYDLSYVIGQSKAADAGGPFWSISKKKKSKTVPEKKRLKKKNKNDSQKQENFVKEFYENLELTSFERKLSIEEVLRGRKMDNRAVVKGKINTQLADLAEKLGNEDLMYIALHYQFGEEILKKYSMCSGLIETDISVNTIDVHAILSSLEGEENERK